MVNEEGFTEEDLKYINEPFTKKQWNYIYTLDHNINKWTQTAKETKLKQTLEKKVITGK